MKEIVIKGTWNNEKQRSWIHELWVSASMQLKTQFEQSQYKIFVKTTKNTHGYNEGCLTTNYV